jgi:hypothetical protein
MKAKNFVISVVILLMGFPHAASAAISATSGTVEELLSSDSLFGECMARVQGYRPPSDCSPVWVSVDCAGDFNSKESSRRMFEVFQMALALEKPVDVFVEDTQRHNGWCVVKRVDVRND